MLTNVICLLIMVPGWLWGEKKLGGAQNPSLKYRIVTKHKYFYFITCFNTVLPSIKHKINKLHSLINMVYSMQLQQSFKDG